MVIYGKGASTNIDLDIRFFRRYPREISVTPRINERSFNARTVDYSLIGVGIFIDDPDVSLNKGDLLDLCIEELDLHEEVRAAWVHKTPSGLRVGIQRIGQLSGHFGLYPVSDILIGLQRTSKEGILEVRYRSLTEKLFLRNGNIVFAESNYEKDRLGDVLLKSGKINRKQYAKADEMQRKSGGHYAAILVHMGYVKPPDILHAVGLQAKRVIKRLFLMKDAEFEFIEGPFLLKDAITLKLSISDMVYRELKKNADVELLESYLLDSVVFFSSNPLNLFKGIHFSAFDRTVISCVDGSRRIRDIIHLTASEGHIKPLKTIYALLEARFLKINEKNGTPPVIDTGKITETPVIEEDVKFKGPAAGSGFDLARFEENSAMAQQKFRYGKTAFWDKNFDAAARSFAAAIQLDASVPDYHYFHGCALLSLGNTKKAVQALTRADELNPMNADILAELGHAYQKLDFPLRARAYFDKARKLDPSNKRAVGGNQIPDKNKKR
ncbi:MAG: tetratricopeptide repeat protein [Nitrospirae bacterium]|nr:tetratricopeptide repeat protein [Nitrospirota bacterium]